MRKEYETTVEDLFFSQRSKGSALAAKSGLGAVLAWMYAERNANVVIASHDSAELQRPRRKPQPTSFLYWLQWSISDPQSCVSLVEQTLQKFARVDTMVCNTGIHKIKAAEDHESGDGASFCMSVRRARTSAPQRPLKGCFTSASAASFSLRPSREAPGFRASRHTPRRSAISMNWCEQCG